MTLETEDSDMPFAEAVLRQLIDRIPNLQLLEPPKPGPNSPKQLVFLLTRTDAKAGVESRVLIQGPPAPMTPSDLRSFLKRQLMAQGFVVY